MAYVGCSKPIFNTVTGGFTTYPQASCYRVNPDSICLERFSSMKQGKFQPIFLRTTSEFYALSASPMSDSARFPLKPYFDAYSSVTNNLTLFFDYGSLFPCTRFEQKIHAPITYVVAGTCFLSASICSKPSPAYYYDIAYANEDP